MQENTSDKLLFVVNCDLTSIVQICYAFPELFSSK